MLNIEQHHPNTSTTTEMTNYDNFLFDYNMTSLVGLVDTQSMKSRCDNSTFCSGRSTDHKLAGNALGGWEDLSNIGPLSPLDNETR